MLAFYLVSDVSNIIVLIEMTPKIYDGRPCHSIEKPVKRFRVISYIGVNALRVPQNQSPAEVTNSNTLRFAGFPYVGFLFIYISKKVTT